MIALAIWLAGLLVLTWLSLCAFAVAVIVVVRLLILPIQLACGLWEAGRGPVGAIGKKTYQMTRKTLQCFTRQFII